MVKVSAEYSNQRLHFSITMQNRHNVYMPNIEDFDGQNKNIRFGP